MDRMLVGVDGSPTSIAAAVAGSAEAAVRNAETDHVYVLAPSSKSRTQTGSPAKPPPDKVANAVFGQGDQALDDAPFGGVSSAIAQACRVHVIMARRERAGCQSRVIGDRRKINLPRRFQ
jgi:hypothetical protein